MRALNALLTIVGFVAIFAVVFVTSAVVTAALHRGLAAVAVIPLRG